MEKSERIQHQAALAVTNAWQGSCRSKLYEELGWESLSGRRPLYRQRNSNTFHELRCKSLRYMSSSFPDGITSWNNVIIHFDDILYVLKNIFYLLFVQRKKDFWYT